MQVATIRIWTATGGCQSKGDETSPSRSDMAESMEALLGLDYAFKFRPTFLLAQTL